MVSFIIINNRKYKYYEYDAFEKKQLFKQVKQIKEKIKAVQSGFLKDKVTKDGKSYYSDYPDLLVYLENIIIRKTR